MSHRRLRHSGSKTRDSRSDMVCSPDENSLLNQSRMVLGSWLRTLMPSQLTGCHDSSWPNMLSQGRCADISCPHCPPVLIHTFDWACALFDQCMREGTQHRALCRPCQISAAWKMLSKSPMGSKRMYCEIHYIKYWLYQLQPFLVLSDSDIWNVVLTMYRKHRL